MNLNINRKYYCAMDFSHIFIIKFKKLLNFIKFER